MYETTQNPIFSRAFLAALLANMTTLPADPLLETTSIRLFTAGPTPITQLSVEADFTNADFVGYAAETGTFNPTAVNTPSGEAIARIADANFICTAATTPNTVLGWYMVDVGSDFICGEYFPAPVPITTPGDFISLNVAVALAIAPIVSG